jgi:hypothetical protein
MPVVMGLPTDFIGWVGRIRPQTVTAAATVTSNVVDASRFEQFAVLADFGDYAAGNNGSVAVEVYGDTTPGGSFATLITGKTISAALHTGSLGDDSSAIINLSAAELKTQGFTHFRVSVTPTNQNLPIGLIVLGYGAAYLPAKDWNLAAVKQIVV